MPSFRDLAKERGIEPLTKEERRLTTQTRSFRELAKEKGIRSKSEIEAEKGVFASDVEQFAVGAGKGVLSTLRGASSLGERGIKALGRLVTPKRFEKALGFEKSETTSAENLQKQIESSVGAKEGSLTQPVNTLQRAGFTTEQIAEFFLPGTASFKAGKAAKAGLQGGKGLAGLLKQGSAAQRVLPSAAGVGTTAVAESGLALGQTAVQEGEAGLKAAESAALGAGIPVAGRILGKGLGGLKRGVGKFGAEVAGRTTTVGSDALFESFKNPSVIKFAREAGDVGPDRFLEETVDIARSGLRGIQRERGKAYRLQLEKLDLASQQLKPVLVQTKNRLKELSDDLEVIVEGENVVNKAVKNVQEWSDSSAKGLDKLKQRLDSFTSQLEGPGKSRAKRIVQILASEVRDGLRKNVDGYSEMTRGYEEATGLIRDVSRALSLGEKSQIETVARKLSQTVRRGSDTRKQFLEELSKASGVDIRGRVAGSLLSKRTPEGLVGRFSDFLLGGQLPIFLLAPDKLLFSIPALALTSPRIMGEFTTLLGRIDRKMIEANKLSPQLQRAFRQIFLEAQREVNEKT